MKTAKKNSVFLLFRVSIIKIKFVSKIQKAVANSVIDTIYQIITDGVKKDILHLYTDDDAFTGNLLTIREKKVVNFGSCSYLGARIRLPSYRCI